MGKRVRFFESTKELEEDTIKTLQEKGRPGLRLAHRMIELLESFAAERRSEKLTGPAMMLRFRARLRQLYPNPGTLTNMLHAMSNNGLGFEADGTVDAEKLRRGLSLKAFDEGLRQEKRLQPLGERPGGTVHMRTYVQS
jgi:hypothetical protein